MAAPRPRYGEAGEGVVRALVPVSLWVQEAKAGRMSMQQYRERYLSRLWTCRTSLVPGALEAQAASGDVLPIQDGDTLLCCCSRAAAAAGECHRVWAAQALAAAGWRVILDGEIRQHGPGATEQQED